VIAKKKKPPKGPKLRQADLVTAIASPKKAREDKASLTQERVGVDTIGEDIKLLYRTVKR
jgi:hypothetical protein